MVVGAGTVGALALAASLFGAGVASADDTYNGQTYSKASSAAKKGGAKVVIAARVGSKLEEGDCIVTNSQMAPFVSADDGEHVGSTVQFSLNCNGDYASESGPGASVASPMGREAKAAADAAAAKKAAQAKARAAQAEQELQQEAVSGDR